MIYRGRIRDGVVVFDERGAPIPEGTAVKVEPMPDRADIGTGLPDLSTEAGGIEALDPLFTMGELAVETGVPDLSTNIDHYLYGHPKVEDDGPR